MAQMSKIIASVIIVNFNNAKYLEKCLISVINQSFKEVEIIVIDDISTDNSIEILKKYKAFIKFYINKKKTSYGSYNQFNSFSKGFTKSKGKYIFFLDSDDYFKKDKIKKIINQFKKNKNLNIIFDLPILKFEKKKIKKNFFQKKYILSNWPRFTPQSCISVKRYYAKNFFKMLKIKKYPTIWFDFRLAIYSFLKDKKIFILREHLTFYRQLENSASNEYRLFSKKWWIRRKEAHEFFGSISNKLKVKNKFTLDKIITYMINIFLDD